MKKKMNSIKHKFGQAVKRICELKDRSLEIIQSEEKRGVENKDNCHHQAKKKNIIDVPEGEEKEKGKKDY